jgi:hypothetical protein
MRVLQLDLLALLGLGDPLREAIAVFELKRRNRPLRERLPGREQPPYWTDYMASLDTQKETEIAALAATVDVRLRAASNRMRGHPRAIPARSWLREADGTLRGLGIDPLTTQDEKDHGAVTLRRLDASLPVAMRSPSENVYDRARNLLSHADELNAKDRRDLAYAASDIGLDVEPQPTFEAPIRLVEAIRESVE